MVDKQPLTVAQFDKCPYCGENHRRVTLDDACAAEWAASERTQAAKRPDVVDSTAQPAPIKNQGPAVWNLVVQDMVQRDFFGEAKYGTRLQPNNGRDFLVDAYQEALDLVVYLRGAIYERDAK